MGKRFAFALAFLVNACGGNESSDMMRSEVSGASDAAIDAVVPGDAIGKVPDAARARVCEPGRQLSCACPGGATGAQRCAANGAVWGDCECLARDAATPDEATVVDAELDWLDAADDAAGDVPNAQDAPTADVESDAPHDVAQDANVVDVAQDAFIVPDDSPAPPTCTDGVQNGDESDIDCGGKCSYEDDGTGKGRGCLPGQACNTWKDCKYSDLDMCVDSVCAVPHGWDAGTEGGGTDGGGTDGSVPDACVKKTCGVGANRLKQCGPIDDGCGGNIDCGGCDGVYFSDYRSMTGGHKVRTSCGGGAEAGVCGSWLEGCSALRVTGQYTVCITEGFDHSWHSWCESGVTALHPDCVSCSAPGCSDMGYDGWCCSSVREP